MKRMVLGLCTIVLVGAAVAWSGVGEPRPEFDFQKADRNPVTSLKLNNNPAEFQFAVVSDRTGGHRAAVFSRAVEQLNLLQPEFVISVGDLIEGYTEEKDRVRDEWREFQSYVCQLQMPFFYVPGNHDITNPVMDELWKEKFGRSYYHFVYRNILFFMLNSEDPPGNNAGRISKEQLAYVTEAVEANRGVNWTLVFIHKPMWTAPDLQSNGWLEVERILGGRPYTVFAGHHHKYQRFVRNGMRYYKLATTGGISKMRGVGYGEFDHILWVTMKPDGPTLANILMDGILPEDLQLKESAEEGVKQYYRRPTHPATGQVYFEGQAVPGAYVVFQSLDKDRPPRADAITGPDGSFTLSTYTANDGAPTGEYAATVVWRKPFFDETGQPGPNLLPARYASTSSSDLKFTIKSGKNNLVLDLKE